jgi:uronate dehydrogenase
MGESFVLEHDVGKRGRAVTPIKLLITGAAGRIGSHFAREFRSQYDLRLLVHPNEPGENLERVEGLGEICEGDLSDLDRMKEVCDGVDTILHLAADPNANQTWDVTMPTNIVGTYNTFAAAKANGVRKVIFASSIHAVSGYEPAHQVRTSDPVNPGDLYGVSKCFGEALARYMAGQEGIASFVLRIGAWFPPEWSHNLDWAVKHHDAFVSARDLNQLIHRCIEDRTLRFAIFNAISDNTMKRLDIADACALVGYEPKDDLVRLAPGLCAKNMGECFTHSLRDPHQKSGLRNDLGLAASAGTAHRSQSSGKRGDGAAG